MKRLVYVLLLCVLASVFSCNRKSKQIQYIRVAIDTTAHDEVESNADDWMDEPLIDIPDIPGELTGTTYDDGEMDRLLQGKD